MNSLAPNILLNIRSQFLSYSKAIGRIGHIARESEQTKHIDYLRTSPATNRYKVLSEYNGNGHMREANSKDDMIHDKKFLKKILKEWQETFEADYNAQTYTSKHKSGKLIIKQKSWRSDMVGFNEIIITFGTDRVKEKNERLNVVETEFVAKKISFDRVERFVSDYCAKHGVKCLMIAEHNDEKTKCYQIMPTNYNFTQHANLRYSGKNATRKAGKELQDMGAKAFVGQALRGKPSKEKHKDLAQMHEAEQIYKDEKKLKADIKQAISEYISTLLTEKNPLIGNKYYQLTIDNKEKLIKELTQEIFDLSKENINIISDEALKEQLQILTTKLLEQDEIIKQSNTIKDGNDELKDKLEQLKDSKALLIQNSNLKAINEDQASKIANLQKSISSNEAVLQQAKSNTKELEKLKDMKNIYEHSAITIKQKDDEVKELRIKLQTNIDQTDSIKTLEQEIDKKVGEITTLKTNNQILTAQNEKLINQNSTLRAFKAKAIGLLVKIANRFPLIAEMIKKRTTRG